ncbi:MAG: prolipoprotein diacylglyceryl transferase [Bacteriovoracaceae bacterium]
MYPVIFESASFTLFSYPLFMGLSWGLAYRLSQYFLERMNISEKGFAGLFWGIFVFSWIGSKIFFLAFSSGGEFVQHSKSLSFWLGGGFVFYGGLIFSLLYLGFYCFVLKKFPIKKTFILLGPLSFGHALGRVGCFLAGCCFGVKTDMVWGYNLHGHNRHPVQLYESIGLLIIGGIITKLMLKNKIEGIKLFVIYFLGYSLLRFTLEFYRGDIIRGVYIWGLSTSQLISIILFLVLILYLVRLKVFSGPHQV